MRFRKQTLFQSRRINRDEEEEEEEEEEEGERCSCREIRQIKHFKMLLKAYKVRSKLI